jgi:hypothetical protein
VKITKDIELAKSGIKLDEAKIEKKALTAYDIMTVKHIIESFTISKNLPLSIVQDKNTIKIFPAKDFNADETVTQKTILNNYGNVMDFLSALSSMPYQMGYTQFCLGTECAGGLEATIEVKGITPN